MAGHHVGEETNREADRPENEGQHLDRDQQRRERKIGAPGGKNILKKPMP